MKRKGFTLIELLAVIVILAIIALIATPMVLNTIEEAKKGGAMSSGYAYVSEVETRLASYMLKNSGTSYNSGKYSISTLASDLDVSLKGEAPTEGKVCIGLDGVVTKASLKINGYIVHYDGKQTTTAESEEVEDITCSIFEDAAKLVYAEDGKTCKTDGSTYTYMDGCYIKGTSTNNYVWYNGFMWRIMGINSDGTVRLITDDNATALSYGTSTSYRANQGNKYIHDWLNEYFYEHLNSSKSIIKEGAYFCSESSEGVKYTDGRTTCAEGNTVTAKVGIIAMDEYVLATGINSYLDNKQVFWTMTPFNDTKVAYIATGFITWEGTSGNGLPSAQYGIRPVINVDPNSISTSGNGEATNFFVLGENKNNETTGKLSDVATSGEYVSLEGKTYRIVSKDSDIGVKLILDGFYEEKDEEGNSQSAFSFGDNNTFTLTSGIGQKLDTDVLSWLGVSNDQIVETTYYQGDSYALPAPYTTTLNTSNGVEAKVGLIQIGEMLATQSSTMLTKNYTDSYKIENTKKYWTMNKYIEESSIWSILKNGNASVNDSLTTSTFAIRPVIVVKSDLNITGGNGTWNNPYQI